MSWLKQILGTKEPKSASSAKTRLMITLQQDRGNLPPGLFEELRDEIIDVITKKLKVSREEVMVNLSGTPEEQRLIAEIQLPALAAAGRRRR